MRAPPILARLPQAYEVESTERAWLAWRRELAPALREAGYGPESDGARVASVHSGRRPLEELGTRAGTFLVRRFTHGGLLRGVTGARFADAERPFRELCLSAELVRLGIPTPEVVAARAQRAAGLGFRLELVVRGIEDALDLGQVLVLARRGEIPRGTLRALARAAGRTVARLHAVGFVHADLQPNNLLVRRAELGLGEPALWVLDLDRSAFLGDLTPEVAEANLRRLYRFVARRERRDGSLLARSDLWRFLVAYEPKRERRKDHWRAIAGAHVRTRRWHAIGWMVEDALRSSRDPRGGR